MKVRVEPAIFTPRAARAKSIWPVTLTGVLVNDYGDNMADFEEAIRQAHDNGATGITFFTAGLLKDKHLAILKKYNEAYNR